MFLNVPLVADWMTISNRRQQLIQENLRKQSLNGPGENLRKQNSFAFVKGLDVRTNTFKINDKISS